MPVDIFLVISGVTGGSTAVAGAIEVQSFSFGVTVPVSIGSATGGAGAGKVTFNPFSITKTVDSSSPTLFSEATTGGHWATASLYVRTAGATSGGPGAVPGAYLVYQFKLVFVESITYSAAEGNAGVTEVVSLDYGAVTVEYFKTGAAGVTTSPIAAGWNQVTNSVDTDTPLS